MIKTKDLKATMNPCITFVTHYTDCDHQTLTPQNLLPIRIYFCFFSFNTLLFITKYIMGTKDQRESMNAGSTNVTRTGHCIQQSLAKNRKRERNLITFLSNPKIKPNPPISWLPSVLHRSFRSESQQSLTEI